MKSVSAQAGEGWYTVRGTALLCGQDVTIAFTGGTLPHVGAVSLAVYEPGRNSATVSTLSVYTHRDDLLASRCAKQAASALRCTAVVSVGIHVDDALPRDLEILTENFQKCYAQIAGIITNIRNGVTKDDGFSSV